MMNWKVLPLAAALTLSIGAVASATAFPDHVKMEQGTVAGAVDDAHSVIEWQGVPYAQPATGENRYQPPQKAKKFKGVLECTQPAPSNIQTRAGKVLGEEGVLTLDIVRPDTTAKNLPVLVFFHGGNNQTSNSHLIEGKKLAQEGNLVYVSVQYRLGLLGWNNLPAISEDKGGNFGLMDQAEALDWVRNNIKHFGGDEKNVTVSGFSAGGRDVLAMLISPAFDGKFDKAISYSGGLTVANEKDSQKMIAKKLAPLVVEDGKAEGVISAQNWLLSEKGKDAKAVREYLMNIDAKRVAPIMAGAVIRMSAFPHLYGDDKMLPREGFNTKKYNVVPLLLMASQDEFTSFAARDPYFKDRLDEVNVDEKTTKEWRFANKYGSAFYGFFNGQQSAETIYPHYKKGDIYVAGFAFGHSPEMVGDAYRTRYGAMHGIFCPFISDQPYGFKQNNPAFDKPGAKQLSAAFISSISNFVRTGNPNTNLLGNTWNKWNPEYRPEMIFDANENQSRIYSINSRVSYNGILAELANDKLIDEDSKNYIIHNVLNGRWFSGKLDEVYGNENLWNK